MNIVENEHNTRPLVYEVQLNLLPGLKSILTSDEVLGTICVSVPHELGGVKRSWNPEHLFLGAMSSSFTATFLSFAEGLDIAGLQCDIVGHVKFINGLYAFTSVDLLPTICVRSIDQKKKAEAALLKTKRYCLVTNTVKCLVLYHSQVLAEAPKEAGNVIGYAGEYI